MQPDEPPPRGRPGWRPRRRQAPVRQADSGHTGGPLSSLDFTYILFKEFLKFDPDDPDWNNRDRFVMSIGHESALLYTMLCFVGWLDVSELKRFRQLGSKTPGHPERGLTPGVEATTGPLGQGVGNAVGMAIAEKILSEKFGPDVVNHYTEMEIFRSLLLKEQLQ